MVLGAAGEPRPAVSQVTAQAECGLLAERHGALLPALPVDEHELLLEVDVGELEVNGLLGAQAGRVDELEERPVSKRKRLGSFEGGQERVCLALLRRVRKPTALPPRERKLGHAVGAERRAEERAYRGELAADCRLRELARLAAGPVAGEPGGIAGEDARVDVLEPEPAVGKPGRELLEVGAVRPARRVGER